MGPIVAGMLWDLLEHLQSPQHPADTRVFFCARGGLTLRRAVELFADRVGIELRLHREDFMISRLAAARVAIQQDPARIAAVIETELAGRSHRAAALALAGVSIDGDPRWNVPFTLASFVDLLRDATSVRCALHDQANLLRLQVEQLRGDSTRVILCDTGVFGSIALYLQVGIPRVNWKGSLLYRANYKKIVAPHFAFTIGVVSESDAYVPWRAHTAALLYWPLIESMFEPELQSVRRYHIGDNGRVVSDLEVADWQHSLDTPSNPILSGAWAYLANLSPRLMHSIPQRARAAWLELRRRIVFPSRDDVEILAAGPRCLDFGTDEMVAFTPALERARGDLRERVALCRHSMWPEGELRKQFPQSAGAVLVSLEGARILRAAYRSVNRPPQ